MHRSFLQFPSTDLLRAQSRGSHILSGLCWRSQRGDSEDIFLPFAFPDGAGQPGLTSLPSAGSRAHRRWWETDALQGAGSVGCVPLWREAGIAQAVVTHSLTLAKWKSSVLTCKPTLVCGVQETPGTEGVSARAVGWALLGGPWEVRSQPVTVPSFRQGSQRVCVTCVPGAGRLSGQQLQLMI